MQRVKYYIYTILFLLFIVPSTNVLAGSLDSNLVLRKIDNVYFVDADDTKPSAWRSGPFYHHIMDGKTAYCIEPGYPINTYIYNSGDWNITSLSAIQRHQLELFGHYGYDYPGHQNDRYLMATQELMWEYLTGHRVEFYTGANGTGQMINVELEKMKIQELIRKHEIKPSFSSSTQNININDNVTLEDKNKVLNEYQVMDSKDLKVAIQDNKLTIQTNNAMKNVQIRLVRKHYDNQTTLIYYNGENQKLAFTRVSDPVTATLNVNVISGKITISKLGEKAIIKDKQIIYEDIPLSKVKFGIYANHDIIQNNKVIFKQGELVQLLETDENGYAEVADLFVTDYTIKEMETNPNYILSQEQIYIDLSTSENKNNIFYRNIEFKNHLKHGSLDFTKIDLTDGKPLPNVKIQIFTENNELVFEGLTDNNGKVSIHNLPAGIKMYIVETECLEGYQLNDEKIFFEIKENGEIIKATMTNEKIVKVPNTLKNDTIWKITPIFLIIVGIGLIIYENRK